MKNKWLHLKVGAIALLFASIAAVAPADFVKDGDSVTLTNGTGAALVVDEPVQVGFEQVGITRTAIGAGATATGEVGVRGVYKIDKASGAIAQGAKVYGTLGGGAFSATNADDAVATGLYFIGFADIAAASATTTVRVRLAKFAEEGDRYLTNSAATLTLSKADFLSTRLTLATSHAAPTITLPAVANVPVGCRLTVVNSGAGNCTLDGNSSENVNGATTDVVYSGMTAVYESSGAAWILVTMHATDLSAATMESSASTITVTAAELANGTYTAIASAAGTQAVTLEGGATVKAGTRFVLRKTGSAGAVTITPTTGTIAGGATHASCDAQNDWAVFVSDGTNWVLESSVIAWIDIEDLFGGDEYRFAA